MNTKNDLSVDGLGKETELTLVHENFHPYIVEHSTCSLCGSELTYYHQTDFAHMLVKEKRKCKSCGIELKQTDFPLN